MFGYFSCVHWLICTSSGENGSAHFHMCWLGYLFLWFGLAFLVLHLFWTFVFKPLFLRIISQRRALRVSDFIFMGGIFSQVFHRTAEIRCICTYKVFSSPFQEHFATSQSHQLYRNTLIFARLPREDVDFSVLRTVKGLPSFRANKLICTFV